MYAPAGSDVMSITAEPCASVFMFMTIRPAMSATITCTPAFPPVMVTIPDAYVTCAGDSAETPSIPASTSRFSGTG